MGFLNRNFEVCNITVLDSNATALYIARVENIYHSKIPITGIILKQGVRNKSTLAKANN